MPPGKSVYKPSRLRLKPTKQLLLLHYIHTLLCRYIYIYIYKYSRGNTDRHYLGPPQISGTPTARLSDTHKAWKGDLFEPLKLRESVAVVVHRPRPALDRTEARLWGNICKHESENVVSVTAVVPSRLPSSPRLFRHWAITVVWSQLHLFAGHHPIALTARTSKPSIHQPAEHAQDAASKINISHVPSTSSTSGAEIPQPKRTTYV